MMTSSVSPPHVAPYAKSGEVQVRVSAKAESADAAFALVDPMVRHIRNMLGDVVYGVDVGSLQAAVVALLREEAHRRAG